MKSATKEGRIENGEMVFRNTCFFAGSIHDCLVHSETATVSSKKKSATTNKAVYKCKSKCFYWPLDKFWLKKKTVFLNTTFPISIDTSPACVYASTLIFDFGFHVFAVSPREESWLH